MQSGPPNATPVELTSDAIPPSPVRDGVNATRLRLPDEGPWTTAMDYMMHRWGHIDPQASRTALTPERSWAKAAYR